MKVKIKKNGKVKEFKLISKWSDVNYKTWLKLIDFQNNTRTKEAEETIAALSNIPKDLIKQLDLSDVVVIMSRIAEMQQEQDSSLKRIIEVEGKRYGFHPDLNSYTIEAYDGDITIRTENFKKMAAEQVQSALVFFYNLGKELLKILPLYLMETRKETMIPLVQSLLQKNGGTLE